VLPVRVAGYSPAMLDELCSSGEVVWAGRGSLPGNDGWITLLPTDSAGLLLSPISEYSTTPLHEAVLSELSNGAALFFRMLSDRVGSLDDQSLVAVLWDLVWAGVVTNDTLAPLRSLIGTGRSTHRSRPSQPRSRYSRGRPVMPNRTGPPSVAGRWSLLPERDTDETRRAAAVAETLLDRHGVVTRGSVTSERVPGGFAAAYRVLSAFEETGRIRRGYFVAGLGASQFAAPGAVDRMRALAVTATERRPTASPRRHRDDEGPRALVLAATDPANPYGAALAWPDRDGETGHKAGRKAGALVVLVDGTLALYVERGGRSLLTFVDESDERLQPAVDALALAVREGHLGKLTVERADGEGVLTSTLGQALSAAGFHATPRGLRLRG
jgi:ATP-dependent helicase Lhr and Lhr-like helicase